MVFFQIRIELLIRLPVPIDLGTEIGHDLTRPVLAPDAGDLRALGLEFLILFQHKSCPALRRDNRSLRDKIGQTRLDSDEFRDPLHDVLMIVAEEETDRSRNLTETDQRFFFLEDQMPVTVFVDIDEIVQAR
jgi:hypothetical protein